LTQETNPPGYPKFKRRKAPQQSFDIPQFFTIDQGARWVHLPKIGRIKTVFSSTVLWYPKTCTIISTRTGKFYISIVVDDGKTPPTKTQATDDTTVGIDVGLTMYITLSTGDKVKNPRHLQNSLKRYDVSNDG
jgi:putative transposase